MSKEKFNLLGAFSIKKFINVCLKNWYVFIILIIACVGLAGAFAVIKPQKQEVLAQLMLKDDTGGGSSMFMAGQIARSFSLGDMFGGASSTDNETFVIKSHAVFLQTVKDLGLNEQCYVKRLGILWQPVMEEAPLALVAPDGIADTLSRKISFRLVRDDKDVFEVKAKIKRKVIAEVSGKTLPITVPTPYGQFIITKGEGYEESQSKKFMLTISSYNNAASSYERIVGVYVPDRKSDFIDLSFVTDEPDFGKKLLSTIIANYEDVSNQYKLNRSIQSLKLVDDRLASLASELQQSERDIETFKKENSVTDVDVDAQYLMSKTGSLESALLEAQTNFEVIKLTKEFISNPENNYSLIPELYVSASSAVGDNGGLISKYNELILSRMELLPSATGNNTMLKQLDQQIDALRGNIITSINRAYQNSSVTLRDLKNEDLKNKVRLGQLPSLEREYLVLKRDNLLQEQLYLFLLQQREELNMSLNSRSLPAQVIDEPYVLLDKPGLSLKVLIALGMFFGLLLAAVYLFFFKMPKYPISSLTELKSNVKAPVFDGVSYDTTDATFAINANDTNAESFRKLRADVQFALASCDGKIVAVTSVNDNEGKSYISTNLAATLAITGKRVTLVDLQLREPKVAARLGIGERKPIFSEYVYSESDEIPTQQIEVNRYVKIDVIATQAENQNPSDLLASDRFASLISKLRLDNDYVILVSSRIKDYCDINYLTSLSDITLVVSRSGIDTSEDIDLINTLYADSRLKRMALTPNCFKS